MTRRESREAVFCLLYENILRKDADFKEIYALAVDIRGIEENDYIKSTYTSFFEHCGEVDELIEKAAVGWRVDRMSAVTLAILRLCAYELAYTPEVPLNVAINEAVELAKKYDADTAAAFINGILIKISCEMRPGEAENSKKSNE